jgi:serine/threonine-protein kinase
MPIAIGTQLGSHEITALLGKGGMGEVYRARDLKLKREVAIKILPEEFARDPERISRFQREAELLASLNHPNIAAIYDIEEASNSRFLVLELVEGDTLADRIRRGPLLVDEALHIARSICEALEAAHEKGVIHRDLKPGNVKVTPDGKVKVLDFGLAKALEGSPANTTMSNSPTLTMAGTNAGVILGTAAYMSPEQARGRAADQRSDVFSFGCVLFEMLTGRQAFHGEEVSDVLAAVLKSEPDLSLLPPKLNPRVRELLRRCLEKNQKERWHAIGDTRVEIDSILADPRGAVAAQQDEAGVSKPLWKRVLPIAISVIVTGAITGGAVWNLKPQHPLQLERFAIVPTPAQPFAPQGADRDVAISPDGTKVVYRASAAGQLVVRSIDQLDARVLAGISEARTPFISAENRWLGFFSGGGGVGRGLAPDAVQGQLKKVPIDGGPPLTLCRIFGAPRGASWGSDNNIVFATNDPRTGLLSVPAGGGEPRVLTKPDTAKGEVDHLFPFVLPGARAVLFTVARGQTRENWQIAVLDLKTSRWRTLIDGGSYAEYVDPGYIVYAAAGTLRAVRFDPSRLEVLSDPVPVVERVMTTAPGAAEFALSRTGSLVYVPGDVSASLPRSLVWINRQGKEETINAPTRSYAAARISPDGTRVALDIRDQEYNIWVWDLARQTLTRLTDGHSLDTSPVWTPDSARIIFMSAPDGIGNLHWQAANNTGAVERLTISLNIQAPTSISPDGTRVVFTEGTSNTSADILMMAMDGKRATEPLIHTKYREVNAEISPNGRWIAYESNESGTNQVYVRPFPNVDAGHWQVSTGPVGSRPLWARSGRELFYLDDAANRLMVVPVQSDGETFRLGSPVKVFDYRLVNPYLGRSFDISPDGQRFLVIKDATNDQSSTASPTSMVVVVNWLEELKQRVSVH